MHKELKNWIRNIITEDIRPPIDVIAYNFGLFETENGYSMYLTGSKEYNEYDDDWACNEDYSPKNRYIQLSKEYAELDWQKMQQKAVASLKEVLNSDKFKDSFFLKAKAITCGFDDGELIRIQ